MIYASDTHNRYKEGPHGACNPNSRGGCSFSDDSMHIGEFAAAVSPALISIHQVKRGPDRQRDTRTGIKDPVAQDESWQQV